MILDLSRTVENVAGEPDQVVIQELSHKDGAKILGGKYDLNWTDFPDGQAINNEYIRLTTHTATHMDAPYHYGPHCAGRPAKTIDQIPLEWCVQPGKLIDLSQSEQTGAVTVEEIQEFLKIKNLQISPYNIILINTGSDKDWGTSNYFTNFRGMSPEATNYLLDFGVKVIGIDSFGFDPPFEQMLDNYHKTNDKSYLWPAHMLGRKREYCQIERVTNLSAIPKGKEFTVFCAPIKLKRTGASWCRVIAQIRD